MDALSAYPLLALSTGETIGLVALGLALAVGVVWLAWKVCKAVVIGAWIFLEMASPHGFIGLALYILLWVLAFPVMLVLCFVSGAFMMYAEKRGRDAPLSIKEANRPPADAPD